MKEVQLSFYSNMFLNVISTLLEPIAKTENHMCFGSFFVVNIF